MNQTCRDRVHGPKSGFPPPSRHAFKGVTREVTVPREMCKKCGDQIDGSHNTYCRACFTAYMKDRRRSEDPAKYAVLDSLRAVRNTWESRGLRQCESCGAVLPMAGEWFMHSPKSTGGITRECKKCATDRVMASESYRQMKAAWSKTKMGQLRAERAVLFSRGLALCRTCGEIKPAAEFAKDTKNVNGLRATCKPCMRAASMRHRKARQYGFHRAACGDYYDKWCASPCLVCGERRHKNLIHAHHRDPGQKLYTFNKLTQRGKVMLPLVEYELSKCSPLCGNCHALVHIELDNGGKNLTFDDLIALVREKYAA